MDWLNKLLKPRAAGSPGDPAGLMLYVQCNRCGAPVAVRINIHNDLSTDEEEGGYYIRKEIMDSKCFRLMVAELHFDGNRKVTSQTIEGGKFITQQEYQALIEGSNRTQTV